MNFKSYFFAILSILFVFSCNTNKPIKTESFKVWGNCEKCKKTIENAISIDGITERNWNVESHLMTVTFDTTKTSLNEIQRLIAEKGYDNDGYYGDDYAYGKLEDCCQYERKSFE